MYPCFGLLRGPSFCCLGCGFYGLVVAGVGVAILMNKKEDDIEEIKKDKENT